MAFLRALVQAVDSCNQPLYQIASQADAADLANCSTISGSIQILSLVAGTIDIDGPQEVQGDLEVINAATLTSLSSTTITTINGAFNLSGVIILSTLEFSVLESVSTISWTDLPALSSISFPVGGIQANSITVSNTFLSTLGDGAFATGPIDIIDINNNPELKAANFTTSSISLSINLAFNGNAAQFSLPNLEWATNITARDLSQLNMPSLAIVNGSMILSRNIFSSFLAPKLVSIGNWQNGLGTLSILANTKLSNLFMPLLESIGALQVASNSALQALSFPSLTSVGGDILLSGNFSTSVNRLYPHLAYKY